MICCCSCSSRLTLLASRQVVDSEESVLHWIRYMQTHRFLPM